jgi:hypothetical protein
MIFQRQEAPYHMPVAYLNAIVHHSHAIYEENHSFALKGITLCPTKNGGAFFSNESNICDEVLVYLELQNIYCAALRGSIWFCGDCYQVLL